MIFHMTLKAKYSLFISLLITAIAVLSFFLFKEKPLYLIIAELSLILLSYLAYKLYQSISQPINFILSGVDAIKDQDFTTKFLKTGSQEMDQLISVYNEMIDRLRHERVHQQEQHYFLIKLINASPTGIILLNFDGEITEINPRALAILNQEDSVKGESIDKINHPIIHQLKELAVGEAKTIKLEGLEQFKCQKSKFIDRGFEREFIMIEELSNEILKTEKRAYGKVIRMMAHEVNNSIGPINSILQSLAHFQPSIPEDMQAEYQSAIDISINRNDRLNTFMQNFAKVVRLPQPNKKRIELNEVAQSIATLMSVEAQMKNIKIITQLSPNPIYIQADQEQLEQALVNIIKNSVEAIEENGEIILSTNSFPANLCITDNGKGIDPAISEQIFTPFYSSKAQGQGIGLTLVREILHQHEWSFSLKTISENRTVFEIKF